MAIPSLILTLCLRCPYPFPTVTTEHYAQRERVGP